MKKHRNKNRFFKLYKHKELDMWATLFNEYFEIDNKAILDRVRKLNMKKYKKQELLDENSKRNV